MRLTKGERHVSAGADGRASRTARPTPRATRQMGRRGRMDQAPVFRRIGETPVQVQETGEMPVLQGVSLLLQGLSAKVPTSGHQFPVKSRDNRGLRDSRSARSWGRGRT